MKTFALLLNLAFFFFGNLAYSGPISAGGGPGFGVKKPIVLVTLQANDYEDFSQFRQAESLVQDLVGKGVAEGLVTRFSKIDLDVSLQYMACIEVDFSWPDQPDQMVRDLTALSGEIAPTIQYSAKRVDSCPGS